MKVRVLRSFLSARLRQRRPIVFYRQNWESTPDGKRTIGWTSETPALPDTLPPDTFFETKAPVVMALLHPLSDSDKNEQYVLAELEEFDTYCREHIRVVLHTHYHNVKVLHENRGREFPWFLFRYRFSTLDLTEVLATYDAERRNFFIAEMKDMAPLLSRIKQKDIQEVCDKFGIHYQPKEFVNLSKALDFLRPWQTADRDANIYNYTARALYNPYRRETPSTPELDDNLYLRLRRWLTEDTYAFHDFQTLLTVLRACAPLLQLRMLQRYFRAVELGQTRFDANVVHGFVRNRYDLWGYWCNCYANPMEPVFIGTQLLAGAVLHALDGGKGFTSERLIEFALEKCCREMPKVDFGLYVIFSPCDCGIVETPGFKGFVCYSLLVEIDVAAVSSAEKLHTLVQDCFREKSRRDQGYDSWTFFSLSDDEFELLSLFLTEPVYPIDCLTVFEDNFDFDPGRFLQRLQRMLETHFQQRPTAGGRSLYEVKNALGNGMERFLSKVTQPRWMIVEPRKNVSFGNTMLAKEIGMSDDEYYEWSAKNPYTVPLMENRWLRERISEKLRRLSGCEPDRQGRFVIPYSEEMMQTIRQVFKSPRPSENSENMAEPGAVYTVQEKASGYLCLPDKATEEHARYVVCHGRKCFCHAYYSERTWREYGLMDFMRILNGKYVEKAPFGEIPGRLLCDMGRQLEEAARLFPTMACSYCGHLREKSETGALKCVNPDCPGKRR